MKSILLIVTIIALVFAGCSPAEQTAAQTEEPTVAATQAPTDTPEPTQEPTATPQPQATPDADPASKLIVTDEEFNSFLSLWPLESTPIEDQGELTTFSMSSQVGYPDSSLNYNFKPDKSISELKEIYMALVVGEWEDSEYSVGPTVYGGLIEGTIDATCQIANYGDTTEVFLGIFIESGSDELDALLESHWPVGLIELHESINDDTLFFIYFGYEPGIQLSFSKSYEVDDAEAVIEYYKELLAGENEYEYFEGGEYENPYIKCSIGKIAVKIAISMDTQIEITYALSLEDFNQ